MSEIIFQSIHSNLNIPYTKEYTKNFQNRPVVRKNIVFKNARLVLDDEEEEDKVAIT